MADTIEKSGHDRKQTDVVSDSERVGGRWIAGHLGQFVGVDVVSDTDRNDCDAGLERLHSFVDGILVDIGLPIGDDDQDVGCVRSIALLRGEHGRASHPDRLGRVRRIAEEPEVHCVYSGRRACVIFEIELDLWNGFDFNFVNLQ